MIRPLRMVGLDLSTAATGVASTHDPYGVPFLSTFTVPDTAKRPLHEQIAVIKRAVRMVCGVSRTRTDPDTPDTPDLVVIEGTFSRDGAHASDYPLHAVHATVKQLLWEKHIPYVDVSNSALKVWATGSGATRGVNKATKDKIVSAVIAAYGSHMHINPRDDNQADAVALLTLGLAKYGQPLAPYGKLNAAAFKSPKWPDLRAAITQEARS